MSKRAAGRSAQIILVGAMKLATGLAGESRWETLGREHDLFEGSA